MSRIEAEVQVLLDSFGGSLGAGELRVGLSRLLTMAISGTMAFKASIGCAPLSRALPAPAPRPS